MYKIANTNKKSKLYNNMLVSYILVALITVVITAFMLTVNFQRTLVKKIYASQEAYLKSASNSMDDAYLSIKTLLVQLYLDEEISILRNHAQPDQLDIIKGYNGLGLYTSILPYIKSIYVYNDSIDKFYISVSGTKRVVDGDSFHDNFAKTMLAMAPEEYSMISPVSRMVPVNDGFGNITEYEGFTYMYRYFPQDNETFEGAIFINVSDEWIRNALIKADSQFDNRTCIFNKAGEIIYSSDDSTSPEYQTLNSNIINEIQNRKETYGSLVDETGNQQTLIIYAKYSSLSWTLVKEIPMDDIMHEVYSVRNIALLLASLVLLIGGFVALFVSKSMYKPIGRIMKKLTNLEIESSKTLELKRNEYFKKILLSEMPEGSDIQTNLNSLESSLDVKNNFVLLYMMIDHMKELKSVNDAGDIEQIKKIFISIALNFCENYYECEVLNWADGDVMVILSLNEEQAEGYMKAITTIIDSTRKSMESAAELSISAAVSSMGVTAESLPSLYNEVREIALGRYFSGANSILTPEHPRYKKYNQYHYPVDDEMKLTKLLLNGEIEHARDIFESIIDVCRQYTFYTVQHELTRLVSASFTALNLIEENKGIKFPYSFDRFLSDVFEMETLKEASDYFGKFFDALERTLDGSKTGKQKKLISQTKKIVQEKYQSYDLSLESIADVLGVSAVYLGRAYKKVTNQSLPGYINSYRIEKAKELLQNTDKTINSISLAVGYLSNQSFYRVFKKLCGVTPLEYRKNKKLKSNKG